MATITEKDYPIQSAWVIKTGLIYALGHVLVLIVVGFQIFVTFARNSVYPFQSGLPLYPILFFIFLILLIPFHFVWAEITQRSFHYSLDDQFLTIQQGIISKQNRHLPYGVIQNVLLERGFFDRIFGLAVLKIENAAGAGGNPVTIQWGTRGSSQETVGSSGNLVSIPGLKADDAGILKNLILQKIQANPTQEIGL